MHCNDCGKDKALASAHAHWICFECWDLRAQVFEAMKQGAIHPDEFRELQRVIGQQNGHGAAAMRRTLGLEAPQI